MVAESNAILIKVGNSREIQVKQETVLGRQAECDVVHAWPAGMGAECRTRRGSGASASVGGGAGG